MPGRVAFISGRELTPCPNVGNASMRAYESAKDEREFRPRVRAGSRKLALSEPQKKHALSAVSETVPKPYLLRVLGLAFERKADAPKLLGINKSGRKR